MNTRLKNSPTRHRLEAPGPAPLPSSQQPSPAAGDQELPHESRDLLTILVGLQMPLELKQNTHHPACTNSQKFLNACWANTCEMTSVPMRGKVYPKPKHLCNRLPIAVQEFQQVLKPGKSELPSSAPSPSLHSAFSGLYRRLLDVV